MNLQCIPFIISTIYTILLISHVFSNCEAQENSFNCDNTCESVWFKFQDLTADPDMVEKCDPIFREKYADIS